MTNILEKNSTVWGNQYHSPNVESYIFRLYGRILKPEFGLPYPISKTKLLDFGCGQGAAANFFQSLGFECWGVDQNSVDVILQEKDTPT